MKPFHLIIALGLCAIVLSCKKDETEAQEEENVTVNSVSFSSGSGTLTIGDTLTLIPVVDPPTAEVSFTWSTEDAAIATVSTDGLVSALRSGTVSIVAKSDAKNQAQASYYLAVVNPVASISLNKNEMSLVLGVSDTLITRFAPKDADNLFANYNQSVSGVVDIDYLNDSTRIITGRNKGTTVITVSSDTDPSIYQECTVTVYEEVFPYFDVVKFVNNRYFILGFNGVLLSSADAENWVHLTTNTTENLDDIIYANGNYVVVGNNGLVLTSTDGVNWAKQTLTTHYHFGAVTYGNDKYVVVGGSGTGIIYTSTDLSEWTQVTVDNETYWTDIIYANEQFTVVGLLQDFADATCMTSIDGATWEEGSANRNFGSLIYVDTTYIGKANDGTYTSTDGLDWDRVADYGHREYIYTDKFISVLTERDGSYNSYEGTYTGGVTFATTIDGTWTTNWHSDTYENYNPFNSICYGNGLYVVVGSRGNIFTTTDLETFTEVQFSYLEY